MKRENIYVGSVALSAFLLFLLQPILARMLLPVFGGSPAVWNTCIVFFQVVLLAGYAYAHGSLATLGVARQRWLHGALLVASLLFLPRALAGTPSMTEHPVVSILAALALIAGVPFFLLSTSSSLTQRWYSLGSFESSADPFWLYAASNAGSLGALLAYPLFVEPAFGIRMQIRLWTIGYAGYVVLTFLAMLSSRANARDLGSLGDDPQRGQVPRVARDDIGWKRRARWVALAAIASSLLLSVTMQITTEIVAAPLFWVVPLALYLLTFIIAFSHGRRPRRRIVAFLTTIGIALCLTIVLVPTLLPLWAALIILLGTLFTGALLCHGDLAGDRPSVDQLTDYYLWIAVGGMVGGVLNGIIAPLAFTSVVEYPLTLACLALVVRPVRGVTRVSIAAMAGAAVLTAFAAAMVMTHRGAHPVEGHGILQWQLMPVVVLAVSVLLSNAPAVFPWATLLTAAFMIAGLHFVDSIVDQGRSFFGVSRVTENANVRIMVHGVTVHGTQWKTPGLRDIPVSYYYPDGPLGWVVSHAPPGAEIGIVGLGAGSLSVLGQAGQHISYFEIDPLVEKMARRDFTFLRDAKAKVDVQIGDGRQLLERTADDRFDLLVIDAFSSDAIPMHLLTDEAIAMYLRKLKPAGLLVMHISNRYVDLSRVFRGWRFANGKRVAIDRYVPGSAEEQLGVLPTVAVAIARSGLAIAPLAATRQWYWLEDDGPAVHWTDDRASLLPILNSDFLKP